jgi:hypothetical protein
LSFLQQKSRPKAAVVIPSRLAGSACPSRETQCTPKTGGLTLYAALMIARTSSATGGELLPA